MNYLGHGLIVLVTTELSHFSQSRPWNALYPCEGVFGSLADLIPEEDLLLPAPPGPRSQGRSLPFPRLAFGSEGDDAPSGRASTESGSPWQELLKEKRERVRALEQLMCREEGRLGTEWRGMGGGGLAVQNLRVRQKLLLHSFLEIR